MASTSPSEFLTFYRRISTSQSLRAAVKTRPVVARPFHVSAVARHTGDSKPKEHTTRKNDSLDVQSREVKHGTQSRAEDSGSAATREKDERDSVSRAKKDNPEAPDTAIGMQDERGGKGH